MKLHHLLAGTITAATLFLPTTVTAKETCSDTQIVPPSGKTRLYENLEYGFSFKTPANYRLLRTQAGVTVIDPAGYKTYVCLIQNKMPTDDTPSSVDVYIKPDSASFLQELNQLVQSSNGQIEGYTYVGGQKAVVYTSNVFGKIKYIAFFNPNNHYVIVISAELQDNGTAIMQDALNLIKSTFRFQ